MHNTSYKLMEKFNKKFLPSNSKVLDVGAFNTSWTYRNIFESNNCEYTTLNIVNGADIVVNNYDWTNVQPNYYDIVVSGQVFEHDKFFWKTLENMKRVCKDGGYVVIIVPSKGKEHRHPLDCYRFYKDSSVPFSEILDADIIDVIWNKKQIWGDLGMVFKLR